MPLLILLVSTATVSFVWGQPSGLGDDLWTNESAYGLRNNLPPGGFDEIDVVALVIDDATGDVYTGGTFTHAGAEEVNHIAVWNPSTGWRRLGGGFFNTFDTSGGGFDRDPQINDIVLTDDYIYVGGYRLTEAENPDGSRVRVNNTARWNRLTNTWEPLNGRVRDCEPALPADISPDACYGVGVDSTGFVSALHVAPSADGDVVTLSGNFSAVQDTTQADDRLVFYNRVVRWDGGAIGEEWQPVGGPINGGPELGGAAQARNGLFQPASAIHDYGGDLHFAGDFELGAKYDAVSGMAGTVQLNGIARLGGNGTWEPLGFGLDVGSSSFRPGAEALATGPDGELLVGGFFDGVCAAPGNCQSIGGLAAWDGTSWTKFAGFDSDRIARAGRIAVTSDAVYITTPADGGFEFRATINGQSANGLYETARYDVATGTWSGVAAGHGAVSAGTGIFALAAGDGDELYVGTLYACDTREGTSSRSCGGDDDAEVVFTYGVARWDAATNRWAPLGTTVPGQVRDLLTLGDDVYLAGTFDRVYDRGRVVPSEGVARYDRSTRRLHGLGQGLDQGLANALALANGKVYVGGSFVGTLEADGTNGAGTRSLAAWDPVAETWEAVGEGVSASIYGVDGANNIYDLEADGGILYVGGNFLGPFNSGLSTLEPVLARYDLTADAWLPWSSLLTRPSGSAELDANVDTAYDIEIADDGTVYLGGSLSWTKTDSPSQRVEGGVLQWNPTTEAFVPFAPPNASFGFALSSPPFGNTYDLEYHNGTLYTAGAYAETYNPDGTRSPISQVIPVQHVTAIDLASATITPLVYTGGFGNSRFAADGAAYAVQVIGNTLFVGASSGLDVRDPSGTVLIPREDKTALLALDFTDNVWRSLGTFTRVGAYTNIAGLSEGDAGTVRAFAPGSLILGGSFERRLSAGAGPLESNFAIFDVGDDGALPVELAAFTAVADGTEAILTWETASESNNAGFYVEQRQASGLFASLGFVEGAGTTDNVQRYRFTTPALGYGEQSFRLRQVDLDGTATLSDVRTVQITPEAAVEVTAFPNPVRPGQPARITVTPRAAQQVSVEVYDVLGRRVARLHDGPLDAGQPATFMLSGERHASGLYFVRITGEQFQTTERLTLVR